MLPDKENGPSAARPRGTATNTPNTANKHHQAGGFLHAHASATKPRYCVSDTVAGLHRRRKASRRMVPLDCGCGPDPLSCRCTQPPLSEKMIDAGRDAARHILDTGHVPLLEIEVLHALYRRRGDDRALAEQLHAATGGRVA